MLGGTGGTVDDGRFALDGSGTIVRNGTAEVLEDVDGEGNDPADDDMMMSWSLSHSVTDVVPRLGARSMERNGSYISIVFSSYFYDDICLHNS